MTFQTLILIFIPLMDRSTESSSMNTFSYLRMTDKVQSRMCSTICRGILGGRNNTLEAVAILVLIFGRLLHDLSLSTGKKYV